MSESNASSVPDLTDVTSAPRIAVHPCLKHHKPDSRFSHFNGSDGELIQPVMDNFQKGIPGKYEGSLVIAVPPDGRFFARVPKETTRPYEDSKPPAERVHIVLHSRQRLEKVDGDKNLAPDVDWFIVSINAYANTH